MKLKRARNGRYEGRLEPYKVEVFPSTWRYRPVWCGHFVVTNRERYGYRGKSRANVIETMTRVWLEWRMRAILRAIHDKDELLVRLFNEAYQAIRGDDELSPLALRDYLEERNIPYFEWITRAGKSARITWPGGWAKLGETL